MCCASVSCSYSGIVFMGSVSFFLHFAGKHLSAALLKANAKAHTNTVVQNWLLSFLVLSCIFWYIRKSTAHKPPAGSVYKTREFPACFYMFLLLLVIGHLSPCMVNLIQKIGLVGTMTLLVNYQHLVEKRTEGNSTESNRTEGTLVSNWSLPWEKHHNPCPQEHNQCPCPSQLGSDRASQILYLTVRLTPFSQSYSLFF